MKNFREENKKKIEEMLDTISAKIPEKHNVDGKDSAVIAHYLAKNDVSIVKQGIWKKASFEGVSRCSCCELPSKTPNRINQYFTFCPNCGAEMIGAEK